MCIGSRRRVTPLPFDAALSQQLVAPVSPNTVDLVHVVPPLPYPSSTSNVPNTNSSPCSRNKNNNSSSSKRNKHPHIVVQHQYHDHANDHQADYPGEHPARGGVTTPFPLKLHEMLETLAEHGYSHIISWQPHGRAFVVHKPKQFATLLPHYFKLSKVASFQRQLNLYGFQRLTQGPDRGGYYHELFLRNRVFLAHNIQRIKVKGTKVRARSNPDQEPNFWVMPWLEEPTTPVDATTFIQQQQQDRHCRQVQPSDPVVSSGPPPQKACSTIAAPATATSTSSPSSMMVPAIDCWCGPTTTTTSSSCDVVEQETQQQPQDDLICAFGCKTFHYLDPCEFELRHHHHHHKRNEPKTGEVVTKPPMSLSNNNTVIHHQQQGPSMMMTSSDVDMDTFFDSFDIPKDIGRNIEDDDVFCNLLEGIIQ